MRRLPRLTRWCALVLGCGLLLQTTSTTCDQILVDAASGLTNSVLNQIIRNTIYEALGLSSGSSGIGSALTGGLTT